LYQKTSRIALSTNSQDLKSFTYICFSSKKHNTNSHNNFWKGYCKSFKNFKITNPSFEYEYFSL